VMAAYAVILEGAGSFWPQVSPDGRRILYRVPLSFRTAYDKIKDQIIGKQANK